MTNGWETSADAWIADMGETGDFPRAYVLDDPMLARVSKSGARVAVDLGCGEGRFSRMMRDEGLRVIGVDPTKALLTTAMERDPNGDYRSGKGQALPVADSSVDLVVSYLSLIDICDLEATYDEVQRVLRPGGRLLVANLSSFATAIPDEDLTLGWLRKRGPGPEPFGCDDYHRERSYWIGWRGIRVRNYHRPLQGYMTPLLARGFQLTHFHEPTPSGGPRDVAERFERAPMFLIMEWQKPG